MMRTGSLIGVPTGPVPIDPQFSAPPRSLPVDVPLAGSRARLRRNEAIDVIRLVAAAGIVFIHAVHYSTTLENWTHLFRFAVPFYLFASLYFQSESLRRRSDRTYVQYIKGRFQRLYLPFLIWSAIYFLARYAKHILIPGMGPVDLRISRLWTGTEYHLWFLPFLLGASVVLATAHWVFLRRDRRWRWPLIAAAVLGGWALAHTTMPGWDEVFDSPTYAYVQFWRALPAVCWAMAFAWFMTMGAAVYTASPLMGLFGFALALYCSIKQVAEGILLIPRALSGLGCMLLALAPWAGPSVAFLAKYGRYSYGIYLCHVLVIEVIHVFVQKVFHTPSTLQDMTTFVLGFLGSIVLVSLLARSKKLAWMNG